MSTEHWNGGGVIRWCSKGNNSRLRTCNFCSKYLDREKEEETEVLVSDDSWSEEEDDHINHVIMLAMKPETPGRHDLASGSEPSPSKDEKWIGVSPLNIYPRLQ
ncbi:hypothetical protein Bca4012_037420 [Brassica carinata]